MLIISKIKHLLDKNDFFRTYKLVDKFENFLKSVKYGIRNLKHLPVIWRFRTWDYTYLLQVMGSLTYDMGLYHKKHGNLQGSEEMAKDLFRFSELCARITEDNYYEEAGWSDDWRIWDNIPTEEQKQIFQMARENYKKDIGEVTQIFSRIDSFWD